MSVGKGSGCKEVIRGSAKPMDSGRAACPSASGTLLSGSIASVVTRVTVSSRISGLFVGDNGNWLYYHVILPCYDWLVRSLECCDWLVPKLSFHCH